MNISFSSEVEQLNYEITSLKRASKEPAFGQYLCSVESRLIGNPADVKALRMELIRNYNTYSAKMRASGLNVASTFHDAVYPGMDVPVVASAPNAATSSFDAMNEKMNENVDNVNPYIGNAVDSRLDDFSDILDDNQGIGVASFVPTVQVIVDEPVAPNYPNVSMNQMQNGPVVSQMQNGPVLGQTQNGPMLNQMQNGPVLNPTQNGPVQAQMFNDNREEERKPAKIENKAEFAVGGIVLSVLGTVLILAGAIMLAKYFFDSTWQGIGLYGICVAVMLFSELFIRKYIDKLSAVLTSLSFAAFFVVTLVNYFALHIFNMPVAFIILMLLSVAIGVFSYFRNNFLFALIGYFASFLSIALVPSASSEAEVYMIYGIMLCANILWTVFPMKKYGMVFGIIQVFANMFLIFWFLPMKMEYDSSESEWLRCTILLAISFVAFMTTIAINGIRYYSSKSDENLEVRNGLSVAYKVSIICTSVAYVIMMLISMFGNAIDMRTVSALISTCSVVITTAIVAYLLYVNESDIWKVVVCIGAFIGVTCAGIYQGKWGLMIICFVIMIAVSVLTYIEDSNSLKIADLLLKIYMFVLMFYQIIVGYEEPYTMRYVCIAGALIAIGLSVGYKLPVQILMTTLLAMDVCFLVEQQYVPIVIAGILCVAVAIFYNIKWFRSEKMIAFDIVAIVTLVVTEFLMYFPLFRENTLTVVLVLLFGLGILVQFYMRRYDTIISEHILPIALFITFFVPVFRLENVVASGILMGIALFCVTIGFILKQKAIRIYGLVLAMLVCVKVGFYDFFNSDPLIKTVMFFVVGVTALVIAGVYIVIEKKISKSQNVD